MVTSGKTTQAWRTPDLVQHSHCPRGVQSPGTCRCLALGQGQEVLQGQAGPSEARWVAHGGTGRSTVILAGIHCHTDLELDVIVVLVPGQRRWHCYHPPLLPTSSGSRNLLGSRAKNETPVHIVIAIPADCRSYSKLIYPAAYYTALRGMSMPEITQNGKHSSLLYKFICTKLHLLRCPSWRSSTGTHSSYMRCWRCKNRSGTTLSSEKLYTEWEFKTKFKIRGFKTSSFPQSVTNYAASVSA